MNLINCATNKIIEFQKVATNQIPGQMIERCQWHQTESSEICERSETNKDCHHRPNFQLFSDLQNQNINKLLKDCYHWPGLKLYSDLLSQNINKPLKNLKKQS